MKCTKCNQNKPKSEYYKSKVTKSGYQGSCKICYIKRTNRHYHTNRDRLLKERKEKYWKDIEKTRANNRKRWASLPDEKKRTYFLNYINKEGSKERRRAYGLNKYRTDENFRIAQCLRRRMQMAFRQQSVERMGRSYELVGCSIDELKAHLESQFKEGMSWENYGRYGWHIDHIKPLAKFSLSERENQLKAFNWKNLQPLWAEENHRKSSRY